MPFLGIGDFTWTLPKVAKRDLQGIKFGHAGCIERYVGEFRKKTSNLKTLLWGRKSCKFGDNQICFTCRLCFLHLHLLPRPLRFQAVRHVAGGVWIPGFLVSKQRQRRGRTTSSLQHFPVKLEGFFFRCFFWGGFSLHFHALFKKKNHKSRKP